MLSEKADGKMAKAGLLPKTNAERQKASDDRHRALGRKQRKLWATPDEHERVAEFLAELRTRYAVAYCYTEGGEVYEDEIPADELQGMRDDGEAIFIRVERVTARNSQE